MTIPVGCQLPPHGDLPETNPDTTAGPIELARSMLGRWDATMDVISSRILQRGCLGNNLDGNMSGGHSSRSYEMFSRSRCYRQATPLGVAVCVAQATHYYLTT